MEVIKKYFPSLDEKQEHRFGLLWDLYLDWNSKINVISRKDIENLYLHHVLHSLSIAKYMKFKPGSKILDLGCGGGFPGVPLAILFPKVDFHLIDGTKKKIKVVDAVKDALQLENVKAQQIRAEELKGKYDFVVSRAVAGIDKLLLWSRRLLHYDQKNILPNGIIALKGGDIKQELMLIPKHEYADYIPISEYFEEAFFEGKYVVYVQG